MPQCAQKAKIRNKINILAKKYRFILVEGSIEAEFYALDDEIKKMKKNPFLGGLGPNYHIWAFGPKLLFSAISK